MGVFCLPGPVGIPDDDLCLEPGLSLQRRIQQHQYLRQAGHSPERKREDKLRGGDINIFATNDIKNKGADIIAANSASLKALNNITFDTIETSKTYGSSSGNKTVVIEEVRNIGSTLSGQNVAVEAGHDIKVIGSDLIATEDLTLKAGNDVSIIASVDSDSREEYESSGNLIKSKSTVIVNYDTTHNSSNLKGTDVTIEAGNDIKLVGTNIQAGDIDFDMIMQDPTKAKDAGDGSVTMTAGGDITQADVKDVHYYKKETSKSILGGLISEKRTTEDYAEQAIKSATMAGAGGISYDAENNILMEGVTVVSTGNIAIQGKNVEFNPLEEESWHYEKVEKKGFVGSIGSGGISVGYAKSKDEMKTTNLNNEASSITSFQNVSIAATDGTAKLTSVDIYGKEGIEISGTEGVDLLTAKNVYTMDTKHKSSSIAVSIGLQSSIKNTIDNIGNIKELTDMSGDHYDIAQNALNLVGAIRDAGDAASRIRPTEYKENADNHTGEGYKGVSTDPNSYLSFTVGVSKSKSEAHSMQETSVMNNLASEGDIKISSGKGDVTIEGTKIVTDKNLTLEAAGDVVVQSSQDHYESSSKSSSGGVSVGLNIGASPLPISASVNHSNAKDNVEGMVNVNSDFEVGGIYTVKAGETSIHSGANVIADKVDIQAKGVNIESVQDTEISKGKTSGFNIGIDFPKFTVTGGSIGYNYTNSNGEIAWVTDQTSIIAKNGGTIEAENGFTNRGAIIGSKSEENKLLVKAETITVENLEDKIQSETKGGGFNMGIKKDLGLRVPSVSVVDNEVDKRQDTNATAINTEFVVAGEKKSSEDLGFNTDLEKAQVITKDEEHNFEATLPTDLLNSEEIQKLKKDMAALGEFAKAITNPTGNGYADSYKNLVIAHDLNDFIKNNRRLREIWGGNYTYSEKLAAWNLALTQFFAEKNYTGPLPIFVLGERTQTFDGINPFTGERISHQVISISEEDLNSLGAFITSAHEIGHGGSKDKGEATARLYENAITVLNNTNGDDGVHQAYLDSITPFYESVVTATNSKGIIASVPESWKENPSVSTNYTLSGASGFSGTVSIDVTITVDTKTGLIYKTTSVSGGMGLGSPSISAGPTKTYYPFAEKPGRLDPFVASGATLLFGNVELIGGKNSDKGIVNIFKTNIVGFKVGLTLPLEIKEGQLKIVLPKIKNISSWLEGHFNAGLTLGVRQEVIGDQNSNPAAFEKAKQIEAVGSSIKMNLKILKNY